MSKDTSRGYSDDEIALLEKWLREGFSAGNMADMLSRERGSLVSRNAIIGVVHRNRRLAAIGFGRTPTSGGKVKAKPGRAMVRREATRERPARVVARPQEAPAFRLEAPAPRPQPDTSARQPLRVTLVELAPRGCRFPVNDAAPGEAHLFCGLHADDGVPYCAHHAGRAYNGLSASYTRRAA